MRKSQEEIALRLTLSTGKSAGRNSSGPITVFHRIKAIAAKNLWNEYIINLFLFFWGANFVPNFIGGVLCCQIEIWIPFQTDQSWSELLTTFRGNKNHRFENRSAKNHPTMDKGDLWDEAEENKRPKISNEVLLRMTKMLFIHSEEEWLEEHRDFIRELQQRSAGSECYQRLMRDWFSDEVP